MLLEQEWREEDACRTGLCSAAGEGVASWDVRMAVLTRSYYCLLLLLLILLRVLLLLL
jgi:hypothetical protein